MIEAPAFLADPRRRSLLPHLALAGVTVLAGMLDFWALRGYGNDYYAAAVRSMLQSWQNLFYASFDPAGFVSVDKPPVAFWIETLSAKVFGFSGLSVLGPSAVAGAASVLVLGRTVIRTWGTAAGLLAALVLALTPVALVVNRSNNPDGILVLDLVLAAWAGTRALESGRLRWVILTGVLMGLAFNVKMLAAYLVLPGLAVAYLLAAPRPWPVRLGHVGLAGALTVVLSAAWLMAVDLTPASQRPWVGSSQDNSELSLATGYNGLQRILGGGRGGGRFGPTESADRPGTQAQGAGQSGRAGDGGGGGQTGSASGTRQPGAVQSGSPVAASGGGGQPGAGQSGSQVAASGGGGQPGPASGAGQPAAGRPGPPEAAGAEGGRAGGGGFGGPGGAMFGGPAGPTRLLTGELGAQGSWLLPLALAGGLAALLVVGLRRRSPRLGSLLLFGGWFATVLVVFSFATGIFHPYYISELAPATAALTGIGVVALVREVRSGTWRAWLAPAGLVASAVLQAVILHAFPRELPGWAPALLALTIAASVAIGAGILLARVRPAVPAVASGALALGVATLLVAPAAWTASALGQSPTGGVMPQAGPTTSAAGPGPAAGAVGAMRGGELRDSSKLLAYVDSHAGNDRYVLATTNSMTSAPLIIESGDRVISTGGFTGADPILTQSSLAELVRRGEVRYFLVQRGGGGGFPGPGGRSDALARVPQACTAVPAQEWGGAAAPRLPADVERRFGQDRPGAGALQLYDCQGRAAQLAAR